MTTTTHALPPVVDADTWQRHLDELRIREKAATQELDAIAVGVVLPEFPAALPGSSPSGVRRVEDGRAGIDRARPAANTLTARPRCRLIPEQPYPVAISPYHGRLSACSIWIISASASTI